MTDQEIFDKIESALHEVYMTHALLKEYNRKEIIEHLASLLNVKVDCGLVTRILKDFIMKNMNHIKYEQNAISVFTLYKIQSPFYRIFMNEIAQLSFISSP